jgi:hypothetical protein
MLNAMGMKKWMLVIVVLMLLNIQDLFAQCAMCRTQLENNVSNGDPGIAAGINTGILYLLVMPYLAIITLGYFWYKSSRKNGGELNKGIATR